tara:strand:- start:129 stop:560 length:432 start_codon:yes stop_codon:yes gene_type:complete
MEDEFYASTKLTSGEEVFALVSVEQNTENPIVMLQSPVIMRMVNTPNGSVVKVKPWMEIPGDDPVIIKWDKIITMTEIKDSGIIAIYENYLQDERFQICEVGQEYKTNVHDQLTQKMGYISTVNDARKYLEDIYKIKEDKKES